jgi:hypothetical protein
VALRFVSQAFLPGDATWYASDSPSSSFSGVFEDDGQTGYFYAYDRSRSEAPILDALHIYNVPDVRDREVPSEVEIIWSSDGLKAALLINDYPHAVLAFDQQGYCRTGFPPPTGAWRAAERQPWDDSFMTWFDEADA